MAKQKYTRIALKREYLESDILELAERIRQKFGGGNGTINLNTC